MTTRAKSRKPQPHAIGITHFGGAREVGASSYLLEVWNTRLLIDAGARPSAAKAPGERETAYPAWPEELNVDLVLVTHAHYDHVGALPHLLGRIRADVPLYMTPATRDLTDLNLQDAVIVQQHLIDDQQWARGDPTFDLAAVAAVLYRVIAADFRATIVHRVGDVRIEITPFHAGHIVGAASYAIRYVHHMKGEIRVWAMGDISDDISQMVEAVDVTSMQRFAPHVVISESTYGLEHPQPIDAERERLRVAIMETVRGGGHVFMPAFALGRAQEVAVLMRQWNRAWREYCMEVDRPWSQWPDRDDAVWAEIAQRPMLPFVRTYIDGMAYRVANILEDHPTALHPDLQAWYRASGSLFFSEIDGVYSFRDRGWRDWKNGAPGPSVVIAPSGMLAGGRIVRWLLEHGEDPRNAVFFSGYQDEEAPGRRLQEAANTPDVVHEITIRPDEPPLRIAGRIAAFRLRGHIAPASLAMILANVIDQPQHIVFDHGDPAAVDATARRVRVALRERWGPSVGVALHKPSLGQRLRLTVRPDPVRATPGVFHAMPDPLDLDRFAYGIAPEVVYAAMTQSTRTTHDVDEIVTVAFGVAKSVASRQLGTRLIEETLHDHRETWFTERQRNATTNWRPMASARMTLARNIAPDEDQPYWDGVPVRLAAAGHAIVRIAGHRLRLALLDAGDADGWHNAVVALAPHTRIHDRDVVAAVRAAGVLPAGFPADATAAHLVRRGLSERQLDVEARIASAEGEIVAAAMMTAEARMAWRQAWQDVLTQRFGALRPSEDAQALLLYIGEVAAAGGVSEGRVVLSRKDLYTTLRIGEVTFHTSVPIGAEARRVEGAIAEVRELLGMSPTPPPPADTEGLEQIALVAQPSVPFLITSVLDAIPSPLVQLPPPAPLADRFALAFYNATHAGRVVEADLSLPLQTMGRISDADEAPEG